MEPTGRVYSPDLRKLTEEQRLERGAKAAGVTLEEWTALSPPDRTLLRASLLRKRTSMRAGTRSLAGGAFRWRRSLLL